MDRLGVNLGILVDVQNMYHTSKLAIGAKVSYERLIRLIKGERGLVRAFAYIVDSAVNQDNFINHLYAAGFDVRRKPMLERSDGSRKADWDVGITIDAVKLGAKCDVIALVSGDGDFVPLVDYLSSRGIRVELYSFYDYTSNNLIRHSDQFFPLTESIAYDVEEDVVERSEEGPDQVEERPVRKFREKKVISQD